MSKFNVIVLEGPINEVAAKLAELGLDPTPMLQAAAEAMIAGQAQAPVMPPAYATQRELSPARTDESMKIAYLEAKLSQMYAEQNCRAMVEENARLRERIKELVMEKGTQAEAIADMQSKLKVRHCRPATMPVTKKVTRKKAKPRKQKPAKKQILNGRLPASAFGS